MSQTGISEIKEERHNPETKPSVNQAVRKLKELDFQLGSMQNKMTVMHAHFEKDCYREREERRKLMTRSALQKQISEFKRKKLMHESEMLFELEQIRKKNDEQRNDVKQKIKASKSVCRERKHMAYLKLKKEEEEHNKRINKNRTTDWEQKRKVHRYILERGQEGRKQMQKFLTTKIKQCTNEKQEQKRKLMRSIEEKQKAIEELRNFGSTSSIEQDTPTDESRKEFRVKIRSKGVTTVIPK